MTTLFAPFFPSSRKGDAWFFAGVKSSFPNLDQSSVDIIHEPKPCGGNGESVRGCKVFTVPASDSSKAEQVEGGDMILHDGAALQDQVLIFQYKGRIHAVDNKCPHSAFPLAMGTPFDIEDFGVVLSAGIHCPKHGWSFDLITGLSDRNNYTLRRWEVELRPAKNNQEDAKDTEEVWVRRKQRMG